jgi:hypothetical protein
MLVEMKLALGKSDNFASLSLPLPSFPFGGQFWDRPKRSIKRFTFRGSFAGPSPVATPSQTHLPFAFATSDNTAYFQKKRLKRTGQIADEWSSPQIRLKALTPTELSWRREQRA